MEVPLEAEGPTSNHFRFEGGDGTLSGIDLTLDHLEWYPEVIGNESVVANSGNIEDDLG